MKELQFGSARLPDGQGTPSQQDLQSRQGFTTVELLVVLNVSFILVSLALSFFLAFTKFVSSWQRKNDLREGVNSVIQRVSLDVVRSKSIVEITDSTLTLLKPGGNTVRYIFKADTVKRNDVPFMAREEMALDVRTVRLTRKEPHIDAIRLSVAGQLRAHRYEGTVDLEIPSSATERFLRSKPKLN